MTLLRQLQFSLKRYIFETSTCGCIVPVIKHFPNYIVFKLFLNRFFSVLETREKNLEFVVWVTLSRQLRFFFKRHIFKTS